MADNLPTIADSIADAAHLSPAQVSDLLNGAPFVARLPAEESSNGTSHAYTKEISAPVVGFRQENQGRAFSKDGDEEVTVALKILDFSWAVDKAIADASRKGREWYIARKGFRHLRAALFAYEVQVINGTIQTSGGSDVGFAGFANSTGLDGLLDEMVVDATGAAANTASSVYAVRISGEDAVQGVYKGDGPIVELGETVVQNYRDDQGRNLPVYYTPGCVWLAVQIGGARDIGRIINLTAEANKTLTDTHLANLISKFPSATPPTHFLMNRRSLAQLRASRTATNATGAPAPFPTEAHGIQILPTDSILSTEAIIA